MGSLPVLIDSIKLKSLVEALDLVFEFGIESFFVDLYEFCAVLVLRLWVSSWILLRDR